MRTSRFKGEPTRLACRRHITTCSEACTLQPDDQDLKLRLDLISQTLSDYYVAQAKKYLDKPLGSGVGDRVALSERGRSSTSRTGTMFVTSAPSTPPFTASDRPFRSE